MLFPDAIEACEECTLARLECQARLLRRKWIWREGGGAFGCKREDALLTHVELTLNGCLTKIVEIGLVSADLLADTQAQLPQL